jgi:hypothetical protein
MSPQPQSRSRFSRCTIVERSRSPASICLKTSIMTGNLDRRSGGQARGLVEARGHPGRQILDRDPDATGRVQRGGREARLQVLERAPARSARKRRRTGGCQRCDKRANKGKFHGVEASSACASYHVIGLQTFWTRGPTPKLSVHASTGHAVGGRRPRFARRCRSARARQVRERLHELARHAGALQHELQRRERAEGERGAARAKRRPAPEDHGGERDEAPAGGHPVGVEVEFAERQEHAAEPGERPAEGVASTRMRRGSSPAERTARGFSPHARKRRPHGVRSSRVAGRARRQGDRDQMPSPRAPSAGTSGDAPGVPNSTTMPNAVPPAPAGSSPSRPRSDRRRSGSRQRRAGRTRARRRASRPLGRAAGCRSHRQRRRPRSARRSDRPRARCSGCPSARTRRRRAPRRSAALP